MTNIEHISNCGLRANNMDSVAGPKLTYCNHGINIRLAMDQTLTIYYAPRYGEPA
jgi:hypothetical protein